MEPRASWATEDDGSFWCRRHPSAQPPGGGVCPACLRSRLLRLCPDCAGERPYGCSCPSTASSSSLSSLSSMDLPRSSTSAACVGRISQLIDSEPPFRRSRSAAFRLLRARGLDAGGPVAPPPHLEGARGRSWVWPFGRAKKLEEDGEKGAVGGLSRTRSVGVEAGYLPDAVAARDGIADGHARGKGWIRYFPSPMKAFRHRKSTKVERARSPLCRG